jgi:hypothetical protein
MLRMGHYNIRRMQLSSFFKSNALREGAAVAGERFLYFVVGKGSG